MDRKQLISSLAVAGLLVQSSLCSWSKSGSPNDVVMETNFPLAQNQQWAIEESYLLWKPYMGNMWYGSKEKFEQTGNNTSDHLKVKNPEFEWSSGVRMGISRYLSNHDSWDVNLTGTYFYSTLEDHTDANPSSNLFFNELLTLDPLKLANEGEFNWRLNYWTLDLCVGRLFKMTPQVVFHPYLGLRGSWQYQKSHLKAEKGNQVVKGVIDNDFWGVGPRFGTHFMYYFENNFSFLANLAGSLLVGGQKIRQSNTNTIAPQRTRGHDSSNVIRSNLEGMIGLGWEKWVSNHTVRIAPSVAFEGSLWFSMNQIYGLSTTINNTGTRRNGNLGLMGVSFDLQIDF